MAHHYAFTMKVAAEQEPESPSLRHKLEGEESNCSEKAEPRRVTERANHSKPRKGRTTQSHAKAEES